jgi:hypothetical protein
MAAQALALALSLSLALALPALASAAELPPAVGREAAAEKAGLAWLRQIDAGRYDESWLESAAPFRQATTQVGWVERLRAVRAPLGVAARREVTSRTYTARLPNAPEGEYVVIQLSTDFAARKKAIETITLRLERDGRWRAAGYFIR